MTTSLIPADSHSQTPKPILVTDVARLIRSIEGTIWLVQKPEYGFVLRAELHRKQVRIVIPPIINKGIDIPNEPGVETFVVHTLLALENWLESLQK